MDKDEMKRRILQRFKKKITGRIVIKTSKSKLAIEYMYGGKYCLKRKTNKGVHIIELLCDINKVVDLIAKEKARLF